jgi:imidazole glycerol-phosphate synthase subunit HisH
LQAGKRIADNQGGFMIAIVDSGGANIASILFALKRLGKTADLTSDKNIIRSASHVILPGVGAAAHAMKKLSELDLVDTVINLTQPVLGICLGMQLLYEYSMEGEINCLGIIPGKVLPFASDLNVTVPHMGWNTVDYIAQSHLFSSIAPNSYFYFVHGYHAVINEYACATATHGKSFTAAVQYKNYFGVQFHPERSSDVGEKLLENFLRL